MIKRLLSGIGVALMLLSAVCIGSASAQQKSASEKSYMQARKALDAALVAYGGREVLQKIDDISVKFKGTNYARNQSLTPEAPYDQQTVEGWMTFDLKRRWIVFESTSTLPGFRFSNRQILKGDKGFAVDLIAKAIAPTTAPIFYNNVTRSRFPNVLLLLAAERAATLRWLGTEDYEGKKHNVITFATPEGIQITLYLNAQTNLLSKYEQLGTDALLGDAVTEIIFPDYTSVRRPQDSDRAPHQSRRELVQDAKMLDAQVNTHPAESTFDKPTGFEERPEASTNPPFVVTALAKDVHLLQDVGNGYNVLAVVFNDHVLAVDLHAE